jgi:hypothetical protein
MALLRPLQGLQLFQSVMPDPPIDFRSLLPTILKASWSVHDRSMIGPWSVHDRSMIGPIRVALDDPSRSDMFNFVLSVFSDLQYDEYILLWTYSDIFHFLVSKGRDSFLSEVRLRLLDPPSPTCLIGGNISWAKTCIEKGKNWFARYLLHVSFHITDFTRFKTISTTEILMYIPICHTEAEIFAQPCPWRGSDSIQIAFNTGEPAVHLTAGQWRRWTRTQISVIIGTREYISGFLSRLCRNSCFYDSASFTSADPSWPNDRAESAGCDLRSAWLSCCSRCDKAAQWCTKVASTGTDPCSSRAIPMLNRQEKCCKLFISLRTMVSAPDSCDGISKIDDWFESTYAVLEF